MVYILTCNTGVCILPHPLPGTLRTLRVDIIPILPESVVIENDASWPLVFADQALGAFLPHSGAIADGHLPPAGSPPDQGLPRLMRVVSLCLQSL